MSTVNTPLFFFDPENLAKIAANLSIEYSNASPFPNVVIDGFLPEDVLDKVLQEFPGDDKEWRQQKAFYEQKNSMEIDTAFGPFTRHLMAQFNSSTFVNFLEKLTGITGIIPDPHFRGGGLHQIFPGGFLKVHADFNKQQRLNLDRRLNVLLYLNRDWKESYGGLFELWNQDMTRCEKRVLPLFNRLVVFSTTDVSFHGHPDPLTSPEGTSRKSLALYYYTNGRPQGEATTKFHSTLFQRRPGIDPDEPIAPPLRRLARKIRRRLTSRT